MAGEWQVKRIGDLGQIITGKTPSTKVPEYFDGKYPFITIPDLNGRRDIYTSERSLSELGAEVMHTIQLPPGAVMMSCIATIGKCGITMRPSFTNQQINSVICNENVDHKFLYYSFTQLGAALDAAGGGGSVYTNVSKSRFSDIEILLPSLPEQRAIAHILGTLDDKIELNRQMNKTLEEMARAIFKSWFVDFDPVHAKAAVRREHPNWTNEQVSRTALPKLNPEIAELFPDSFEDSELGKIPKGWKSVVFEEIVTAKQGKYLPNEEMSEFPTDEYVFPVWGGNGTRGYAKQKMYDDPIVILTCRGSNCGLINLTESNVWTSNIVFACEPKLGSTNYIYVYFNLCSFVDCISGSDQPQIT